MKKKNLIPEEERSLTLIFQSPDDVEQWIAWYLDGGGEQVANYYSNLDESKWQKKKGKTLVLEGDNLRCPECRSTNYLDLADGNEYVVKRIQSLIDMHNLKVPKKQFLCEDCHNNYEPPEED
jgi:hypothetical protein